MSKPSVDLESSLLHAAAPNQAGRAEAVARAWVALNEARRLIAADVAGRPVEHADVIESVKAALKMLRPLVSSGEGTAPAEQLEAASGVGEVALRAAFVGAALKLTAALYTKWSAGKSPFNGSFTAEDWHDLGVEARAGASQAAVSGAALYSLTHYAGATAPFAAAFVSTAKAVASLVQSYREGRITFDEMIELGTIVCAEGAIVTVATAAGQTLIPLPVLGPAIGAIAGQLLVYHLRAERKLAAALEERFARAVSALDNEIQTVIRALLAHFSALGDLSEAAFDVTRNARLRFEASVRLAHASGVSQKRTLHSIEDLDDFMQSANRAH